MKQSKIQSLFESFITVGSGLIVAIMIQLLIFPVYDIEITLFENVQLATIFTISSIIRIYIIRRYFNRIRE
jgi:hypothetical protein